MFFKRTAKDKSQTSGAKTSGAEAAGTETSGAKISGPSPVGPNSIGNEAFDSVAEVPTPPPQDDPPRKQRLERSGDLVSRENDSGATRFAPLAASLLRRATSPAALGFKTTAELEPHSGSPGAHAQAQEQALAAISAGVGMKSRGHNVVVVGATAPAAIDLVRAEVQTVAAAQPPPSDWGYVANFEDRHAPRVLRLAPGQGRRLASLMDEAIDEMRSAIVATLAGDSYQTRWRAIDSEFQARHQAALAALARTADAHSIALLRTPMGYAVAPAHDGVVVSPETFTNMPPSMQADVRAQITALEANLSELLENAPQVDRQRRARLTKLNREVVSSIVRAALSEPRRIFAGVENVGDFLAAVEADVTSSANALLPTIDIPDILGAEHFAKVEETRFDAYRVNVFVGWPADTNGAPVLQELAPDHATLFGGSSRSTAAGAHHMEFAAGLLHRANGGYLLLDARALTASPHAWPALLAVLNAGAIRPGLSGDAKPHAGSFAQAIPLNVKVVLLVDAGHLQRVLAVDPRFRELFGVEVAFAARTGRSPESERALARAIAAIAIDEGLEPLDVSAVAELIERSARMAGHRDELLLETGDLAGIMRLADNRRAAASHKSVSRDDIVFAWATRQQQTKVASTPPPADPADLAALPTAGMVMRLLDRPSGSTSAYTAYPRFRRATARIQWPLLKPGSIDITSIDCVAPGSVECPPGATAERTIAAYLAAEFGHSGAIALAAALDGDPPPFEPAAADHAPERHATCAGLIAILSAVADLPLPQSIAVAGAIDQFGTLRSQGGINEAIEEFFDACRACALNGDAGVVIPATCQSQLMVRQDIVDAVAAGEFAVWSAGTVADCLEVLTGLPAGTRDGAGSFAEDDVYRRIEDRLHEFHQRAVHPSRSGEAPGP